MSVAPMESAVRRGRGLLRRGKDVEGPLDLDCDVVVVGSGAGGAAASYELAAAGLDVVILEEGGYTSTEHFNLSPPTMVKRLYRDAGTNVIFGRPDILFAEGRTVGGSTVINGGICWRTPDKVLKRWIWENGLPKERYGPAALDSVFARVERMINSAPQSPESLGNDAHLIKKGCDGLGYAYTEVRRNQKDCMGSNNCIFGCPTGAKQSTLVSYLPEAVRHGARLYADVRVDRVVTNRRGRATGVRATVTNPWTRQRHAVSVRSRAVVLSCGAAQTPVLLQASGLGNRLVGKHMLVHPNIKVCGVYDEPVVGWQGTIQGYQVEEFREEGILMATTFVPPSLIAGSFPQMGPALAELMSHCNHMVIGGVLIEDSTSGTVERGPWNQAIMKYQCTPRDFEQFKRGMALLSEIYFAGGAKKVFLPIDGMPPLENLDQIRRIFDYPLSPHELELFTVHVMGTAAIARHERRGACDPQGQLYGHAGLYVADASIFPGAIGVNPQLTIMALATQVAWCVAEELATPSHERAVS